MSKLEGGEVFWGFLSLLTLPVERQIVLIGGLPKTNVDPLARNYGVNPASLLLSVLHEYYTSWLDDFFPDCEQAKLLFDLVNTKGEFGLCTIDFHEGKDWIRLRELALLTLQEVGLEPLPMDFNIEFSDYIEVI